MLVPTRDPVADRIDAVVVASLTTTIRGLTSELLLGAEDGPQRDCAVSFDTIHTLPKSSFRRHLTSSRPSRLDEVCVRPADAFGCGGRQGLGSATRSASIRSADLMAADFNPTIRSEAPSGRSSTSSVRSLRYFRTTRQ